MDTGVRLEVTRAAEVTWSFENEPRSVPLARTAVLAHLDGLGLSGLTWAAGLVVGELVANAVLHTDGPIRVGVQALEGGARVSVYDASPVMPVVPSPSVTSMTGRGLLLVRSLCARFGFGPAGTGKVVWAEVRDRRLPGDVSPGELIEAWADDLDGGRGPARPMYEIELGDVPTDLLLAAKSHVDNLVREFLLAAAGAREGSTASVPSHLAELIETVVTRFSDARLSIKRQALDAQRRGLSHTQLHLRLGPETAEAGEAYLRALDESDAYCRAARLLTLETPPKHRVFRNWYVGEIITQVRRAQDGLPSRPTQRFQDRLLDEIDALVKAGAAAERAARLYSVASALAAATTPEAVADAVLTAGVVALGASGGGLLLPSGGGRLTVSGTFGYDQHLVDNLRAEPSSAELPAAVALRTGEAVWLESREERDARFPDLASFERGTVSMCAVPLKIGPQLLGALRFSFSEPRLFDEDERRFVLALAAQAAQAMDRAQLNHHRADLARRLQRSLLPPRLADVEGLQLAAIYHPLGDGIEVGGDFYDVWPLSDRQWAFALGDVCGTGPEAAGLTALVRYSLRALATPGPDHAGLLVRLNEVLLQAAHEHDDRFCTVVFGTVDQGTAPRVTLASGGHPPALVHRADGEICTLAGGGTLLGLLTEVDVALGTVELGPGDSLVLYTDGVVEARSQGEMFGLARLVEAVAGSGGGAQQTASAIESAVLHHSGGTLGDDLAVLVLQALAPAEPPASASRG